MIIEIILTAIVIYLLCGFLFAIAFVTKGINKVDESAHNSTIGFKIIILPGVVVFWVFLLTKWMKANKEKTHD